jgi:hypothetical protein
VTVFNPADYFSHSLRANPVDLPPQVLAAFVELGRAQRGEPEEAMLQAQYALGGGVLSFSIEHIGDLTHRMTERLTSYSPSTQYAVVRDKVEKVLIPLRGAFRREHVENSRNNAEYRKQSYAEYAAKADAALDRYAHAHMRLPVYNRAQWLARQAAIDLGQKKFEDARFVLWQLEDMLETPEKWYAEATEYRLDSSGELLRYPWPENK